MMLPLAVFGYIDHSALREQQVHVGACVLRTLIALHKRGHIAYSRLKESNKKHCTEYNECRPSHLQSVLPYDCELFGPLAKPFLAHQEGTDAAVSGRRHGALI